MSARVPETPPQTACEGCHQPIADAGPYTRFCPPCRAQRRRRPAKYPWTPEMDQTLREVYGEHHDRKAIAILRKRFGYPKWSVTRRAIRIGAATPRTKEPRWTEAELDIVRKYAWMVPERIRLKLMTAGFTRTMTAVAVQRKRLGARATVDGTTANGLATLLGIDPTTVLRWIRRGWLHGLRSGTTGDNHDAWWVTTAAFRRFLLEHHEAVDLGKAERAGSKLWLLELLTNGAIGCDVEAEEPPADAPEAEDDGAHQAARVALVAAVAAAVQVRAGERGVPLATVARRAGVSERQLTAMLGGGHALSVGMVASVALALGATVEVRLVDAGQGAMAGTCHGASKDVVGRPGAATYANGSAALPVQPRPQPPERPAEQASYRGARCRSAGPRPMATPQCRSAASGCHRSGRGTPSEALRWRV